MRVLYCSENYCPHDHRFLTALANSDHSVFWFRLEGGDRVQEEREIPNGIHVVNWEAKKEQFKWLDYFDLKERFSKVIDEIKPNIIHAGPIQRVAFLPALINFHPLISMSWGFDMLEDAHRNMIWKQITRHVMKKSDWLIADCHTVKKVALNFGFDEDNVTIFPWGVDLQLFSPKGKEAARRKVGFKKDLLIIHTRSWEPRYGVDIALDGFYMATQRIPNLHMIMLGGGSRESEVRDFIESHRLENKISLVGYQKNEKIADYYRAADIYLSASHIDGSSVALLESMACACPAIVSNIPSNMEWIKDGVNGWVFKDGNTGDLAHKIFSAYKNKDLLKRYGNAARNKTEKDANWEKGISKLLSTYQTVFDNSKQRKEFEGNEQ